MKVSAISCLLIAALILGSAPPVEGSDEGYKTSVLPNGLRVILRENHDNPMIASLVYVHAGSASEHQWNNGISHLLEHLIFDGTTKRSRDDISGEIQELSGYINSFTRELYTAFLLLVPTEKIEAGLSLQEDMLFHSIIPENELERERQVIIHENNKDETNVYSLAERFHRSKLYSGTPYALPVKGSPNVISLLTRDEILEFYSSYYIPNNITLLLIGDFEQDAMLRLIESIFGNAPSRPIPARTLPVIEPPAESSLSTRAGDTEISYVTVSFLCPPPFDKDFTALDLLSEYLSSEEISPLVRSLKREDDPAAVSASSGITIREGFSVFDIDVITREKNARKVLDDLQKVIKQVAHINPDREQLNELKTKMMVNDVIIEEKFHSFGILKADDLAIGGIDNYIDRKSIIEEISPEDIRKAAARYLDGANYIATALVPANTAEKVSGEAKNTEVVHHELPNGLRIIIESSEGSDVFAVNVMALGRMFYESQEKYGLSEFLSRMLVMGTTAMDRDQFSKELRSIGAHLTVACNSSIHYNDGCMSPSFSLIRLETLSRFHEKAVDIIADIVRNPSLPEDEIGRVRSEMAGVISAEGRSGLKEGRALLMQTMFEGHPFAGRIHGEKENLSGITKQELVEHHAKLYTPCNLIMSVVTDAPAEIILREIETAMDGNWGSGSPFEGYRKPVPLAKGREVTADIGSKQAYLYLGFLTPGANDPDVPGILALNSLLTTRLGSTLREKEGVAYSVGSSVHFEKEFGYLVMYVGTEEGALERVREGIMAQISLLLEEAASDQEVRRAVSEYRGNVLRQRLSRSNRAFYRARDEYLGWEGEDELYERMKSLTATDVRNIARRCLSEDIYTMAIVK